MKKDDTLFPMPGRGPGRPKSNPLDRREQNRIAQAKRRALLHADGQRSFTFLLREDTGERLRQIAEKEGCDQADAVALAVAKYNDKSADLTGLPAALVDDLEALYPESDLPDALIEAASRWVAEVQRKRQSAKRSRAKH